MVLDNRLLDIIEKLLPLLNKYSKGELIPQIRTLTEVKYTIKNNVEIDDFPRYFREVKASLYPPREGLTDFFVWDDDYEKRIKINKEIDDLSNSLWNCLKKY